jgi:SSS family solute:Na+ symporter
MGAVFYFIYIGTILQATGKVISASTLGAISIELFIILMFIVFVICGISGDLRAVVITDFMQGFMIIIFSFGLLIPVLSHIGGLHAMNEALPSGYLSLVAPHELTLDYILALIIAQHTSWPCQPHHMEICGSARNEMESRIGVTYGMVAKRFCTIAWAIVGEAGFLIYPSIANRELIFGHVIHDFLPIGLTGLVVASFMARGMSSVYSYMISVAALFIS